MPSVFRPVRSAVLRFRTFPQYWRSTETGGKFISVRNLIYNTNGDVERNQITPVEGGYEVEFLIKAGDDCTATIGIYPMEQPAEPLVAIFRTARIGTTTLEFLVRMCS